MRRRGRPRKRPRLEGKRLFDGQASSDEEDSISASDQEEAQDEDGHDEEEDVPLIHSLRASKLRSLKFPRDSGGASVNMAASKT